MEQNEAINILADIARNAWLGREPHQNLYPMDSRLRSDWCKSVEAVLTELRKNPRFKFLLEREKAVQSAEGKMS